MKKALKTLLAGFTAVSLAACGSSDSESAASSAGAASTSPVSAVEVKEGGTYIVAQSGEPATLNPDAVSDDYNYAIAQNIYSRLYKLNNYYEAIPDLATSYDVSDDSFTWTFHLREDAVWTDGEPVTSADVSYSYNTIIENAYAHASVFSSVASIETPDDYTVVFNMSTPDASFLGNLAWYGTFILPKHVLEGQDWLSCEYNDAPTVTSGPFKFDQWNKGTDVQLVRNDDYYGDKPHLDRVIYTSIPDQNTGYQAWLNDEIDEYDNYPDSELDSLQTQTDLYRFVEQSWPSPQYMVFNLEEGPFANKLVRQAVSYAIDRNEVSTTATKGRMPAAQYYIPILYSDALNDDAKLPDYNPDKAEELLQEAGLTKDSDGYYINATFKIMSGGFDDVAQVIVADLEKVGIHLELDVLDYNIWVEQVMDNYDFEISLLGGFQGPDVLGCGRRWTTDGAVNISRYSNQDVDALFADARSSSSTDQINEDMKEIQTYLADDVPNCPVLDYVQLIPVKQYIIGSPDVPVADGGSKAKAGFSELTYVWLNN